MDLSIIISNFNYGHYLPGCIDSCVKQVASDVSYEIIIVDDGSTDSSRAILDDDVYSEIHKIYLENSGIEVAINTAYQRARGDFLVRLDADDLLCGDFIATMFESIDGADSVYYSDYFEINSEGKPGRLVRLPDFSKAEIFERGDFLATGTIYPRSLFNSIGYLDETTKNSGLENYEFVLRAIQAGWQFTHISKPTFQFRIHNNSLSSTRMSQVLSFGKKLAKRKGLTSYKINQYHPRYIAF